MKITKTPFRMSFCGGGTDIIIFNEHGGTVYLKAKKKVISSFTPIPIGIKSE